MTYKFRDLIDVSILQELTDGLFDAAAIPSAIIDMDGEILTASGWQRICTDFHRIHPQLVEDCHYSDSMIREKLDDGEPYVIYTCPRGLTDASSPIIVDGQHLANVFSGQVFLTPPDRKVELFFEEQAKNYGFDVKDYMAAFREIPVFTEKQFRSGISYLSQLSNVVANIGLTRLKEIKSVEALKASESKYRSLFENMTQGAFYQRSDGVLTDYNSAALEMFGLTADQFVGKTSLDPQWQVIHEDGTPFPGETHPSMTALQSGKPVQNVVAGVYNVKKEDYVWLSINATPEFRQGEQKPYQAFVTLHDITDLKKAKQALQKNEKQYRLLFENMMNGFALHEIVTDQNQKPVDYIFLDVNRSFEEFTGLKKDDIVGKKVTKALPGTENDPADWIGRYGDVALTGRPIRFEQFSRAIDKWFSVLAFSPQKGQFATVFQDITQRKQAELEKERLQENLLQAQKMESIGTLAGGIAHDFNNILSIIIGNIELALEDVPSWNPAYKSIQEIETASFRARDVVKQLLSFSRKTIEDQKPIDIAPIVKESLQLIRSSIPRSIEIREVIPVSAQTICANATQIHQIIINLCTNAAHAMVQEQGVIEVSIDALCVENHGEGSFKDLPAGEYVKLMVKDSGIGMDQECIGKIFEPYFTTKAVDKGTGMGLAVVHGIVKDHHAHIFVDSSEGRGTAFSIVFPAIEDAIEHEPEKQMGQSKSIAKASILFVDDEEAIVKMAKMILCRLGYSVETDTNPVNALSAFKLNPDRYDLVISDMTMPQMSGTQFAGQLKQIRPDIPVIICTGHSSLIDEEKARSQGITALIMKPVTMSDLSKVIGDILKAKK